VLDDIHVLHERLERLCEIRLGKGSQLPRLVRLAKKLGTPTLWHQDALATSKFSSSPLWACVADLSAKELRALEYILLCNIGKDFPPPTSLNSHLDNRNLAHRVALFAQMNHRELLVRLPRRIMMCLHACL
jgi:hypothetical protein